MQATKTDEIDLAKADEVIDKYGGDKSWLVMILQDTQQAYNWLPKPVLERVAERLEIPLSHVYNVATFYSSFSLKERGQYIIRVCDGTACHMRGATWLYDAVRRELDIEEGGTTADRLFTFETVACLGACALAPVMTIGPKYYVHVTPEQVGKALASYRKRK